MNPQGVPMSSTPTEVETSTPVTLGSESYLEQLRNNCSDLQGASKKDPPLCSLCGLEHWGVCADARGTAYDPSQGRAGRQVQFLVDPPVLDELGSPKTDLKETAGQGGSKKPAKKTKAKPAAKASSAMQRNVSPPTTT